MVRRVGIVRTSKWVMGDAQVTSYIRGLKIEGIIPTGRSNHAENSSLTRLLHFAIDIIRPRVSFLGIILLVASPVSSP